jgi:hypothetical protein
MPQRCSYCGKTEKQHKGKACVDEVLKLQIKQLNSEALKNRLDDYIPERQKSNE